MNNEEQKPESPSSSEDGKPPYDILEMLLNERTFENSLLEAEIEQLKSELAEKDKEWPSEEKVRDMFATYWKSKQHWYFNETNFSVEEMVMHGMEYAINWLRSLHPSVNGWSDSQICAFAEWLNSDGNTEYFDKGDTDKWLMAAPGFVYKTTLELLSEYKKTIKR